MQFSHLTPWAITMLLATATALALQCGLMLLVMLIGRVRGARGLTYDGLGYWMIQPVVWTAVGTFAAGVLLLGMRWMPGVGRHPFMADVALGLSLSGCLVGMVVLVAILVHRMRRHGRSVTSSWEWIAVLLLVTSPVALLANSAWKLATERAIARSPTVHVRVLASCDESGLVCALALTSSNAAELELLERVNVRV